MPQLQSDFGKLLQGFRKNTQDPQKNNRPLTQERFAEELEVVSDILYTYGTISGWERGSILIHHQDRIVLLGVLQVLRKFQGLFSLDEANRLLRAGGYRALSQTELARVDSSWSSVTSGELVGSAPATYLVGREQELASLLGSLSHISPISLQFVVGRAGIGKTALAKALINQVRQQDGARFVKLIWLDVSGLQEVTGDAFASAVFLYLREEFDEHHILEMAKSVGQLQQQVRLLLNRHPSFVVIDGIETAEQCDLLATLFVNLSHHSKMVVTSRVAPQTENQLGVCFVPDLSAPESEQLLRDHLRAIGESWADELTTEQVGAIYQVVGGHPLSLLSLPKLLRVQSLNTLLHRIQRGHGLSLEQIYTAVWQELSAVAQRIVQSLCFCSTVGVDLSFLVEAGSVTEDDILDGLYMLQQAALLQTVWLDLVTPPLYSLHPLTKQFACVQHKQYLPDMAQAVFRYWLDLLPHLSAESLAEQHVLDHVATAVRLSLSFPLGSAVEALRTDLVIALLPYIQHLGDRTIWHGLFEQLFDSDIDGSLPRDRYAMGQLQKHLVIREEQQSYAVSTSRARFSIPVHTHPERVFQYFRHDRI